MPAEVEGAARADHPGSHDERGGTSGPPVGSGAGPDGSPNGGDRPTQVGNRIGRSLWEVLPAWVVARVLVAVALVAAHLTVATVRPHNAAAAARVGEGLLVWDGGWYQSIAVHGYVASGTQSLRFFPAFPMVGRALAAVPGVAAGPALIAVANLAGLVALAMLAALVRTDLGDAALARRSVWLLALAPAAYTLVLGYADSLLLVATIGALLAARRRAWWWAALAGLVAGLTRPVGLLVLVPVAVELGREVWERRRSGATASPTDPPAAAPAAPAAAASAGHVLGAAAALLAPLAGAGAFLAWVGSAFGDPWLPFRIQEQGGHRGSLVFPLPAMARDMAGVFDGHHVGSALHVPWVVICVVLVVVAFRRLPASYGALAVAMLVVSLTSDNLDSFERYALGAFPLVVAASTFTGRRRVEVAVLVLAGAVMAAYAYGAFVNVLVP